MKLKDTMDIKWPPSVPCLPVLTLFCCTCMPFLLHKYYLVPVYLTLLIFIPVFIFILYSEKSRKTGILISAVAAAVTVNAILPPASHFEIHLNRANSYAEFKGTVINVHYPTENLKWAAGRNRSLIELSHIFVNGAWTSCQGKISAETDFPLQYGDIIHTEGALFKNDDNSDGLFSYSKYLKLKNITHSARLDRIMSRKKSAGIRALLKKLYDFRDFTISRITKGLQREEDKKLLASMFFGYKGLLSNEEKEVFKGSGTIHLFAVSGLHIGIAAALFMLIIRILNITDRWKTGILICSLGFYVLMTGAPSSAVRAFVMISVWQSAKGFRLPSSGINNIAVSALILLVFNPLNLLSAGFLYTFIITAVLVISYRKSTEFFQILSEENLWRGRNGWSSPWKMKLFLLFMCSFSASVAAFGLNILVNDRVIPFSMITNMFTGFLAFLSFTLAILSLSGFGFIFSIQETVLDIIRFAAKAGEYSWSTGSKSVLAVIIFYIVLFSFIITGKVRFRYCSGAVLLLILIWLGRPDRRDRCVLSVNSSSNVPTVSIRHKDRNYQINCSSKLPSGNNIIDCLTLTDLKADHLRSFQETLNSGRVRKLLIMEKETPYFKRLLKECRTIPKDRGSPGSLKLDYSESKEGYLFKFKDTAADGSLEMNIQRDNLNLTYISIDFMDKDGYYFSHSIKIPYSNRSNVREIILRE